MPITPLTGFWDIILSGNSEDEQIRRFRIGRRFYGIIALGGIGLVAVSIVSFHRVSQTFDAFAAYGIHRS